MTVAVSLRRDQLTPLTWEQTDTNFENLALATGIIADGGTTAERPLAPILYQSYFDTTLYFTVWCAQVTPSIVWVNSSGVIS